MDEDTKCSLLKRAFPPGLEDEVTSIETKVARIAGIYLNYETINMNKDIFGKRSNRYDYRVKNHVDLSKLFLQTHMTKYQAIDDSCDSSAVLGIIINIDEFPVAVRSYAENVDTQFLKGTLLGLELVKEIRQDTSILAKYANILKFNLENESEKRSAADKVIQDELITLNERIKTLSNVKKK
ncbi:unnamed protein product [Mytilus edulis]|uniref:Uncharacterized protein n=1 Tax=Mytilus edulis TaxID=6550 RepID=A0A8S3UU03_MYTED|nr:unnamed protein product [Mytilus edulis]